MQEDASNNQVTIGFGFMSAWFNKGPIFFFKPMTFTLKHRKARARLFQTSFNSQLKTSLIN